MWHRTTYNINDPVVISALIRLQVVLEALGIFGDLTTLGDIQVVGHTRVEGEHGRGSTNFSTHVANGSHTSARKRFNTRTLVFDDSTGTALDRENTGDLQNDI